MHNSDFAYLEIANMQINLDYSPQTYFIRSYQPQEIIVRIPAQTDISDPETGRPVNTRVMKGSFVISPNRLIEQWEPRSIEELTADHFRFLDELGVELLLLGTGNKVRFPPPELIAQIHRKRVGFETMDNGAACRTYNFLVSDGRQVAAAFIF